VGRIEWTDEIEQDEAGVYEEENILATLHSRDTRSAIARDGGDDLFEQNDDVYNLEPSLFVLAGPAKLSLRVGEETHELLLSGVSLNMKQDVVYSHNDVGCLADAVPVNRTFSIEATLDLDGRVWTSSTYGYLLDGDFERKIREDLALAVARDMEQAFIEDIVNDEGIFEGKEVNTVRTFETKVIEFETEEKKGRGKYGHQEDYLASCKADALLLLGYALAKVYPDGIPLERLTIEMQKFGE